MNQTFPLFPLLPPELRQNIWHHAVPLFPQFIKIINLSPETGGLQTSNGHTRIQPWFTVAVGSIPALLSVGRESRQEVLILCHSFQLGSGCCCARVLRGYQNSNLSKRFQLLYWYQKIVNGICLFGGTDCQLYVRKCGGRQPE
jgi:hypothetical protein